MQIFSLLIQAGILFDSHDLDEDQNPSNVIPMREVLRIVLNRGFQTYLDEKRRQFQVERTLEFEDRLADEEDAQVKPFRPEFDLDFMRAVSSMVPRHLAQEARSRADIMQYLSYASAVGIFPTYFILSQYSDFNLPLWQAFAFSGAVLLIARPALRLYAFASVPWVEGEDTKNSFSKNVALMKDVLVDTSSIFNMQLESFRKQRISDLLK
eukprot:CAMPEP_0196660026 /NCGR_PEP_ID=MMETSP1086-20130531/37759_1 /TAXON_ID=77921 /ORGANISM="Cyanoptyche  gloeocystis , Strain SAG4.97" /LENGTH=209 /DNA_ID=CAMNT_0041994241 /DNA_START=328 /DNA_END=957 /DNA_ORIENTATION=+